MNIYLSSQLIPNGLVWFKYEGVKRCAFRYTNIATPNDLTKMTRKIQLSTTTILATYAYVSWYEI